MYLIDEIEYYYKAFTAAKSLYLYYHYKTIFEELINEYNLINIQEGLKMAKYYILIIIVITQLIIGWTLYENGKKIITAHNEQTQKAIITMTEGF